MTLDEAHSIATQAGEMFEDASISSDVRKEALQVQIAAVKLVCAMERSDNGLFMGRRFAGSE